MSEHIEIATLDIEILANAPKPVELFHRNNAQNAKELFLAESMRILGLSKVVWAVDLEECDRVLSELSRRVEQMSASPKVISLYGMFIDRYRAVNRLMAVASALPLREDDGQGDEMMLNLALLAKIDPTSKGCAYA